LRTRQQHQPDAVVPQIFERGAAVGGKQPVIDFIFGADEDTLEDVTLTTVAKRGWTVTAVESGLDGLLARKIPNTTSLSDLNLDSLMAALRAARADSMADAALGVAVFIEERAAEMALITSHGEKTHRITYGGPPRSLPRWSVNLALNWLRIRAMESDKDET
jgi:hypothetical protein